MSKKSIQLAVTLLALLGSASLLNACNTVAGAGTDISSAGHVIASDARQATPR